MSQRWAWAWCWGVSMSPPLTQMGERWWTGRSYGMIYKRAHYSYGLLIGRVFIGLTVSRAL